MEIARPQVPVRGERQPHDVRGALPARGHGHGGDEGDRRAHPGPGVRRRSSGRHVLDPHQRPGPELPIGHGHRQRSLAQELEGGGAAPRGRDAVRPSDVQGLLRALRARGRVAPGPDHRFPQRPVAPDRVPGARLSGEPLEQPRVRRARGPDRLSIADHVPVHLRLRPGHPAAQAPQAGGRAGRLRPVALSGRGHAGARARWDRGPGVAAVPEGPQARRHQSGAALRVRVLRLVELRELQLQPLQPRGPRRGLRPGLHPRRWRAGQEVARPGPDAQQEEHLHGFHRGRGASDRPEVHEQGSAGHHGGQRGRAPHGRGDEHAAGPVQGGPRLRALRRRHHDDARRVGAPHRARVRGMGQSQEGSRVPLHEELQPLRQRRGQGLPDHAGQEQLQRLPGHVLGAREVRGQAAGAQDGLEPAPLPHQHGSGRARREDREPPWPGYFSSRPPCARSPPPTISPPPPPWRRAAPSRTRSSASSCTGACTALSPTANG